MPGRGVTLKRYAQAREIIAGIGDSVRLRVEASDASLMPAEIFLHQKTLVDPITQQFGEEFISVASPFDLSIYPANEPDAAQTPAFFRKAVVDILLPASQTGMSDAWNAIRTQVDNLINALNKLDVLSLMEEVRLGDS